MAYTTADILIWADATQPLSAFGEAKRQYTKGGTVDLDLHLKIYIEKKSLSWQYAQDPTDADGILYGQGNYVYALLFPYLFAAQIATGGSGQVVTPGTNTFGFFYRLPITAADFANETDYNDPRIVGKDLGVFWNNINRYLNIPSSASPEFQYTSTGIRIFIDDGSGGNAFDALTTNSDAVMIIYIDDPTGTNQTPTNNNNINTRVIE